MGTPAGRAPRTDLISDGFEASLGGGSHWHGVRRGGTVRTHGPATIRASVSGARVGPVRQPRPPPRPHLGRLRGEFEDRQPLATLSTRRFSPLGERSPETRPSLDEFRTRGGRAAASARGRHATAVAEAARHARVEEAAYSCASRRSPRLSRFCLTRFHQRTHAACYTPPFLWRGEASVPVVRASSWVLEGFPDAPEGFRKGFSTGGRVSDKGFFILAKVFRVGAGSRAPRAG